MHMKIYDCFQFFDEEMLLDLRYKDFESGILNLNDIKKLIIEKRVMYNHKIDKTKNKWTGGEKLETVKLSEMPKHIIENYQSYRPWLDEI